MGTKAADMRRLRKRKMETILEVAAKVGTDPGNLSRVERRITRPSIGLARRLADFYGISLDDVYGR